MYKPAGPSLTEQVCSNVHQPLSTHLILTYFLGAALSSQRWGSKRLQVSVLFVQIGRSVGGSRLMWRTTSKNTFHLFPSFFFISLSIIFIRHAAWCGPFICVRCTQNDDKKERWRWLWNDYMWAGLNDLSSDSSLLIMGPNSPPPSMEPIGLNVFRQGGKGSCTLTNNEHKLAMLASRA